MMRGAPTREPNSPCESLPGLVSASRSGIVSWSESNDSATATRAPPGQLSGLSERPARTCSTCPRQVDSSQRHGSTGCDVTAPAYYPPLPSSVRPPARPVLPTLGRARPRQETADATQAQHQETCMDANTTPESPAADPRRSHVGVHEPSSSPAPVARLFPSASSPACSSCAVASTPRSAIERPQPASRLQMLWRRHRAAQDDTCRVAAASGAAVARSAFLSNFPTDVFGISATKRTSSGSHHFATRVLR